MPSIWCTNKPACVSLLCLTFMLGCGSVSTDLSQNIFTARPLRNPDPILVKGKSSNTLIKVVQTSAADMGWEIVEKSFPMQLRYRDDEEMAVVKVDHQGDVLLITLLRSANMNQHTNQGVEYIDHEYMQWSDQLAKAIASSLD